MKILWVKSDFLHPTTKGGHIRTLEMLRQMHKRHEIHYVACHDGQSKTGLERAGEYCTQAYPVQFKVSAKGSWEFYRDALLSLLSPMPVHVSRWRSNEMRRVVSELLEREKFDALVCDFLTPSLNLPKLEDWVLFQHNVEVMIWRRHAANAGNPLRRWYFRSQAQRLFRYERDICRRVKRVIAVSEADAQMMRRMFGASRVNAIPTGVDVNYFMPPDVPVTKKSDLIFVGSMDWAPNVDGILYFVREIWPLIQRKRPGSTLDIVGRSPDASILKLAEGNAHIRVRGTVPDVRPYLWGACVSVVPLRIGGGTRLKIYESMAAQVPVVSTTIGAEGLEVQAGENIHIADSPEEFAHRCLELLEQQSEQARLANNAREMIQKRFSWDQVARMFEQLLSLQSGSRVA